MQRFIIREDFVTKGKVKFVRIYEEHSNDPKISEKAELNRTSSPTRLRQQDGFQSRKNGTVRLLARYFQACTTRSIARRKASCINRNRELSVERQEECDTIDSRPETKPLEIGTVHQLKATGRHSTGPYTETRRPSSLC